MNRTDTAYLLLGLAAAGERRARGVAAVALAPAALVMRSRVAAPVRGRLDTTAKRLQFEGRQVVAGTRVRAEKAAFPLVEQIAARIAEEHVAERAVAELIARGTLSRVAEQLVEAGVAGKVVDGELVDEVTSRVLASDEMRRVLAFVMGSPELRAALTQQSAGFAEDMAVGARTRTSAADAAAERIARALIPGRRRK